MTIDPAAVRAAITDKTAAIIAVHLHGQMAAMLPLLALADDYGLSVVEDAAQAHGATYTDPEPASDLVWYAGGMGDIGCFSMNGVKNMGGLGDGGLMTISARQVARDPRIVERVRGLRDVGRVSGQRYIHEGWGMRARMDELTALECLLELAELDGWNQCRRALAARYDAALTHSCLQAPHRAPGRQHVFFNYAILAPSEEMREELEVALRSAGIEVTETSTLVADQKPYRTGTLPCRIEPLDVSRHLVGRICSIPLYPELEEEEIVRIVTVLQQWAPAS